MFQVGCTGTPGHIEACQAAGEGILLGDSAHPGGSGGYTRSSDVGFCTFGKILILNPKIQAEERAGAGEHRGKMCFAGDSGREQGETAEIEADSSGVDMNKREMFRKRKADFGCRREKAVIVENAGGRTHEETRCRGRGCVEPRQITSNRVERKFAQHRLRVIKWNCNNFT